MKKLMIMCLALLHMLQCDAGTGSRLKAVIYDFDGLDIGQTDLPDGDYGNSDLSYSIAANPLVPADVLGDRVLGIDLNWNSGIGEFGKGMSRFMELNATADHLNFFVYNPNSNAEDAIVQVFITEDDDSNNIFDNTKDDRWVHTEHIPRSTGWRLISVPLGDFEDANAGGNGIFDAGYSSPGGMLFSVGFVFLRGTPSVTSDHLYLDMICFSEGTLPYGTTILDLPGSEPADSCQLGALTSKATADSTPAVIEGLFPEGKKIRYVNWFLEYAKHGTTANGLPGPEVQHLLDSGYRPIITWEMMYADYARLDPVQPRLDKILNGYFDSYLDAFADRITTFSDTVVIRIFHEFEGDWYPWSLTENQHDPAVYIAAFRHVVDRFRARGATKVLWMWCVNAEPKPYLGYNWIVDAYPGDNYVDIVAADIYNHPNTGVPPWKSFRYTLAENYYYLTTYFGNKPFFICEVACRERYPSEAQGSQTKGEWVCAMGRDLKTYFCKTRALVFFSEVKEHDWRINSSTEALQAFRECIWDDNYFGQPLDVSEPLPDLVLSAYPNPFYGNISLQLGELPGKNSIRVFDVTGQVIMTASDVRGNEKLSFGEELPCGIYFIELSASDRTKKIKVVKASGS